MRAVIRLPSVPALLATALAAAAAPAAAQVTAEDVWAATEAYWEVLGVDVTAEPSREGAVLTMGGIAARGTLPLAIGELVATAPDLVLTERGDGTVLVETASPGTATLTVALGAGVGGGSATLPVTVAWEDREMVASGTPGAVTFTLGSGRMDIRTGQPTGSSWVGAADLSLRMGVDSVAIETTLRLPSEPGGLVGIDSAIAYGEAVYDARLGMPEMDGGVVPGFGAASQSSGWSAPSMGTVSLALPAGGVPLLGIAQAIRDGMRIEFTSTAGPSQSLSVSTMGGAIVSEDAQGAEAGALSLRLDQAGLATSFEARELETRSQQDLMPVPIELTLAEASTAVALPLLAGPGQRLELALALREATFGEELWALADPQGRLPRDPATFALSIEGLAGLPADATDPAAWAGLDAWAGLADGAGPWPIDLGPLDLALELRGAGLSVVGEGRFDLDESDLETFDGLPRPEGTASVAVDGLQGLLDDLVAMGALTPSDATWVRVGLASVLRSTGPDSAVMELEVTPDGRVMVNGVQRL